jgi:hypothetical protein
MSSAFQYRPRFVDIRVRPPKAGEAARTDDVYTLKPGERACDHQGCRLAGSARAPKSRDLVSEHYWFCQGHAAEYNRNWNFFAGMSEGEIRARQTTEHSTGGRPTWTFKAGPGSREAAAARGGFTDRFGMFGAGKRKEADDRMAAERHMGKLERNALADLDLDATAQAGAIRARYIELVKRCHPDANGGDRSAEHKLQRVIKAFKTLQKAKLT